MSRRPLIVIEPFASAGGGHPVASTVRVAAAFAEQVGEVVLLTPAGRLHATAPAPGVREVAAREVSSLARRLLEVGAALRRARLRSRRRWPSVLEQVEHAAAPVACALAARRLRTQLGAIQVLVATAYRPRPMLLALLIGPRVPQLHVLYHTSVRPGPHRLDPPAAPDDRPVERLIARWSQPAAALVLTAPGPAVAVARAQWPGVPVVVLPHAAVGIFGPSADRAAARAAMGVEDDAFVVLVPGQWDPRKDPGTMLKAVAQIDDAIALVVGDIDAALVHDMARAVGLPNDRLVTDLRFVPEEELARHVAASDVVGCTFPGSPCGDSGTVALALHHRRPVVCPGGTPVGDSIHALDLGTTFATGDVADLKAALARLRARPTAVDPDEHDAHIAGVVTRDLAALDALAAGAHPAENPGGVMGAALRRTDPEAWT